MPLTYERRECGEGISLVEMLDPKFKSFTVSVRMFVPRDAKNEALYSIVMDILGSTNRSYPEKDQMSRALLRLYNASLVVSAQRLGGNFCCTLSIGCICDEYTIGGESVSDKITDLLLDCLLDPYFEDGVFSKKQFELSRADFLDDIESGVNNKRVYARALAEREIYKDEPHSINPFDYREHALAATPGSVTEAYRRLISTAYYEISIYGGKRCDCVRQKVLDRLLALKRVPVYPGALIAPSPLKPEPARVEAFAQAKQCQLIMAYKASQYSEYAAKLFVCMLGGSPVSKLFANVREKLSLCYYCHASIEDTKNTIVVYSGLAEDKLTQAEDAIKAQVEALRNGDFTDDELSAAKLSLSDAYLSNYDSKAGMYSWYFFQHMKGTNDSPEDKARKIMELSREDIISEANKFKLDTVFVLKPENGGADNEI